MSDPGEPVIQVQPAPPAPGSSPAEWRVAWQIENRGDRPLTLLAAWLPHGKLRAAERALEPPPRLQPGESVRLDLLAAFEEAPGTVVENTFVILRALWGDEPWRIMVRLLITTDDRGAPANTVELMTVHPIGFSR
ncbi:MAG TPA: hypothetical protein VII06_32770 [Chloroflexota bacterium]|jgi:hypothetical protein